jgi:hypothetical protein
MRRVASSTVMICWESIVLFSLIYGSSTGASSGWRWSKSNLNGIKRSDGLKLNTVEGTVGLILVLVGAADGAVTGMDVIRPILPQWRWI